MTANTQLAQRDRFNGLARLERKELKAIEKHRERLEKLMQGEIERTGTRTGVALNQAKQIQQNATRSIYNALMASYALRQDAPEHVSDAISVIDLSFVQGAIGIVNAGIGELEELARKRF